MRRAIRFAGHFLARFVARAKQLPAAALAENQHSFGAVKGIPVFVTFLHVRRPDALLEDELLFTLAFAVIFEDDVLRVGKLLLIVEEKFSAKRGHSRRMCLDAQS